MFDPQLYPKLLLTYCMDPTVMMNYLLTVYGCESDHDGSLSRVVFCVESYICAMLSGPICELC